MYVVRLHPTSSGASLSLRRAPAHTAQLLSVSARRIGLISFACGLVGVGLGVIVTVMLATNQWAIASWLPSLTQVSDHATPTKAQIVGHVIEARHHVAQAGRFMSDADAGSSRNDQQRLVGALRGAGDAMNRATAAMIKVAEIQGGGWWHSSNACYVAADLLHHAADLVADDAGWRGLSMSFPASLSSTGTTTRVTVYDPARSGASLRGVRERITTALSECAPPAAKSN